MQDKVFAMVLAPLIPSHSKTVPTALVRQHAPRAKLEEAMGLAQAISLKVVHGETPTIKHPRPATLFGEGKMKELLMIMDQYDVELVIVDHSLTPVQQRNLEKAWGRKVVDRTGLILEIFGERARTKEGRLQVELAHLDYQKSRLVRSWTHLERQRGGFGFLGGPGETQIEADRRQIRNRIEKITKAIDKIKRTRELHRKARKKEPYPIVALVGYTNAGKSTLFNHLTGADVLVQDMLFATLDPTMREVRLPGFGKIILSDTVGFISDLPTTLVAAFRATLEEVLEADILLHVRDISHPDTQAQKKDVLDVLRELGVDPTHEQTQIIEVWNKIDLLDDTRREVCLNEAAGQKDETVAVSSVSHEGISGLLTLIEDRLSEKFEKLCLNIAPEDGGLMNWVLEHTQLVSRKIDEETGFCQLVVRCSRQTTGRLESRCNGLRSSSLSL